MLKQGKNRNKLKITIANMDLNRLPNEQKLELCRWYFKVGIFLLPFVWAVNTVWFFKEAFVKPPYEEQKQIKKYVIASGVGCVLWAALLGAWAVTFQTQRASWGAMGATYNKSLTNESATSTLFNQCFCCENILGGIVIAVLQICFLCHALSAGLCECIGVQASSELCNVNA